MFEKLEGLYYTLTVLDDGMASVTNLSSADLVVVVDDGRVSSTLVDALLDQGVGVLLLNDATRSVASSGWYLSSSSSYRRLYVVTEAATSAPRLQRILDPAVEFQMDEDIFATGFILPEEKWRQRAQ